jgi:hypothetical protein
MPCYLLDDGVHISVHPTLCAARRQGKRARPALKGELCVFELEILDVGQDWRQLLSGACPKGLDPRRAWHVAANGRLKPDRAALRGVARRLLGPRDP